MQKRDTRTHSKIIGDAAHRAGDDPTRTRTCSMKSGGSGLNDSHDGYGVRHGADVDGFMITRMTRISYDTGRDAAPSDAAHVVAGLKG